MDSVKIDGKIYDAESLTSLLKSEAFLDLPLWRQNIFTFLAAWWQSAESIEQYTSGSTGKAKPIQLAKRAMLASARRTCAFFHISEVSRLALCLSAEYIAGKMMLIRALVSGAELLTIAPEGNPHRKFSDDIDFVAMVPLQAENMLRDIGYTVRVKTVLLGGAEVSAPLRELILACPETEFYLGYGMTETCSHVALQKIGVDDIYRGLPGVEFACDERGCLVVEDGEVVGQALISNDMAALCAGGFRWLGRWDNIINSGGIKFSPEELESRIVHLLDYPFLLTSSPDSRLGRKIILVIESADIYYLSRSKQDLFRKKMCLMLAEVLDKYALPRQIIYVSQLVRTASGKVDRRFIYSL
ncbi:AMP-binding protein [Desulfotalea psychrophila]|uniref:Related to O-succinylbenzoic acid-CoA ligase (MenE) n=1 Tax=Desulfotalea psychrophila (strain LSv54 / DSM 12343) TaxID=177439 RepID=Q6ARP6_DESPS|nr:AMP-binding protein [Desulfotalea psychrophila]CAG34979.1 related to O-succinylbenzoic acid-CoA ligase (MenE) [Desulfotalea psychrophila LSv54]